MGTKDITITAGGTSVGASATDTAISLPFELKDSKNLHLKVVLSAGVVATAITLAVKDSYDFGSTYQEVGDQSQVSVVMRTVASTSVTAGTGNFNDGTHGLVDNEPVIVTNSGGALPAELTSGSVYYILKTDGDNYKLRSSINGAAITFAGAGSGNHRITRASYEIAMHKEDATDLAQLPIWSPAKVVVTTGSGDSCTVSKVYLNQ